MLALGLALFCFKITFDFFSIVYLLIWWKSYKKIENLQVISWHVTFLTFLLLTFFIFFFYFFCFLVFINQLKYHVDWFRYSFFFRYSLPFNSLLFILIGNFCKILFHHRRRERKKSTTMTKQFDWLHRIINNNKGINENYTDVQFLL